MAQVSYGTITITDTTDIERIYVEYCRSTSNQLNTSVTPPVVPNITVNWSENTPAWVNEQYIWQRSVIKKSGTNELTYGTPVCLTGAQGSQGPIGPDGNDALNITDIEVQYGISADWNTQPTSWNIDTPQYDSSKPNYWTRTRLKYENNTYSDWVVNKDYAITESIYNSAIANSISQSANENAQGAMSQANQALRRTQAKYGTSSTAAGVAAKTASCEGFELFSGAEIFIQFTNKNTIANPTLNVNNTGAKPIKDSDGGVLAEQFYWKDNSLVHFVYDGTNWRILDIVTTEKYNNLVSDINGVSSTIGQHTEQISSLGTRVSTNETNISQTATSITSLVSNQDTYTAPDGTTKTNTIKSAIKQNADNISLRVEKNGVIAAINASTESSGGSAVKISADKVNIEGAAIFTSGRLSTTNLNNTIDGRIPEIPDDISDLTDNSGKIPDVSGLASKSDAVARTQRIYYRSSSSTKPTGYPTAWVTEEGNKWNSNATTTSGWSRKVTPISSGVNDTTKYLYLWTATQKQLVSGTVVTLTANDIALDDSTTVINGGNIITGSITANEITGNKLSAIYADMGNITAGNITKGYNSINFDNSPATLEFKNNSTWANATKGIQWTGSDLNIKGNITATSLTISSGAAVSGVVVPSEIANMATQADVADASYSVEIQVTSIDYVNNSATLVAIPYYQGSTTMPTGVTLSYRWYKNGTVLANTSTAPTISGATTNTLQLGEGTDFGSNTTNAIYTCVIS